MYFHKKFFKTDEKFMKLNCKLLYIVCSVITSLNYIDKSKLTSTAKNLSLFLLYIHIL